MKKLLGFLQNVLTSNGRLNAPGTNFHVLLLANKFSNPSKKLWTSVRKVTCVKITAHQHYSDASVKIDATDFFINSRFSQFFLQQFPIFLSFFRETFRFSCFSMKLSNFQVFFVKLFDFHNVSMKFLPFRKFR